MKPTRSKSFQGRRNRKPLNESLNARLVSYAAAARAAGVGRRALEAAEVVTRAAGAAGVGLLLSASPASARIVYTATYTTIPLRGSFPLDLNHDGIIDFNFSGVSGSPFFFSRRVTSAQAGNAILGNIQATSVFTGHPLPAALPPLCRQAIVLDRGVSSDHTRICSCTILSKELALLHGLL